MELEDAYNKIRDWSLSKWNFTDNELYYIFGYNNCLILYMEVFPKWKELLKKGYSDDQLIDYFLEIVRHDLPELKNLSIDFKDTWHKNNTYKTVKI